MRRSQTIGAPQDWRIPIAAAYRRVPEMLEVWDRANGGDVHYVGWARHSYNDYLNGGA